MDLLARDAGNRFIGAPVGRHFLGGPALHVLARIWTAIEKRRHRSTTNRFKFVRFELCQIKCGTGARRTFPALQKNGPGFRGQFSLLACYLIVVATALPARDHAAIVALNGRGHHAAVSPWANCDAARANADSDV
jgi:hypothetical protein